jgi:hypothetical protein
VLERRPDHHAHGCRPSAHGEAIHAPDFVPSGLISRFPEFEQELARCLSAPDLETRASWQIRVGAKG